MIIELVDVNIEVKSAKGHDDVDDNSDDNCGWLGGGNERFEVIDDWNWSKFSLFSKCCFFLAWYKLESSQSPDRLDSGDNTSKKLLWSPRRSIVEV